MPIRIFSKGKRAREQLRKHYEIEKALAHRLHNASRKERRYLYKTLYDELYRQVVDHPQLIQKTDFESRLMAVSKQMRLLKRFLKPGFAFLEVGPGDCSLSFEVAQHVRKVYAIDVSEEIAKSGRQMLPRNLDLIISDGISIPVPKNSISVAYSNQLMEHLHPDDAFDQLKNIYSALSSGGVYLCITPNRVTGPHDISKYFDKVATGFHLKEYTLAELSMLFRAVGFYKTGTYIGGEGFYISFPSSIIELSERFLNVLPFSLRKGIALTLPSKALFGIIIVGIKRT